MKRKSSVILTKSLADKVSNRTLVEVNVEDLIVNPIQPQTRFKKNTAKYRSLLDSVRHIGVLDHIHHSGKTMHMIHGHRRVEVLKDLGIKTVWSYMYKDVTQKEEQILFEYLNNTTLSFGRKQQVDVYLAGGEADSQTLRACKIAFEVGEFLHGNGQRYLHKIARSKMCTVTLNEATTGFVSFIRKDTTFVPVESDMELKALIHQYCTARISSPYRIKQILWDKDVTPRELYNHIKARKTIVTKTVLSDG